jgi:hypothetical protein
MGRVFGSVMIILVNFVFKSKIIFTPGTKPGVNNARKQYVTPRYSRYRYVTLRLPNIMLTKGTLR